MPVPASLAWMLIWTVFSATMTFGVQRSGPGYAQSWKLVRTDAVERDPGGGHRVADHHATHGGSGPGLEHAERNYEQ